MSRHGLLVVFSKSDRLDPNTCPFSHVADVASAEPLDRIESMGRFEVATTEEKTQLIGWRSQLCRYLLDRYRKIEVAFALGAVEHRGKLESFLLDAVQDLHPGHTLAPLRVECQGGLQVKRAKHTISQDC